MQEKNKRMVYEVFVPTQMSVAFDNPILAVNEIVNKLEEMGLQDVPKDLRAEWGRQVAALHLSEEWELPEDPDWYIIYHNMMTDEEYRIEDQQAGK